MLVFILIVSQLFLDVAEFGIDIHIYAKCAARTRCIYENGTESDILLQTLRKNVVGRGYAVTELQEETENRFFTDADLTEEDKVTGYVYVLRSLSDNPEIKQLKNLYKIIGVR